MQTGLSVNEMLFLALLAGGACVLAWRLCLRRERRAGPAAGAVPDRKPGWFGFGAELFAVTALVFTCRVAMADWPLLPTGSMEPTQRVGERLLADLLACGPRLPFTNTAIESGRSQRADLGVFRCPPDVSQFHVERLIGLPGDLVPCRVGTPAVNGAEPRVDWLGAGGEASPPAGRGPWLHREAADGHGCVIKLNPFVQGRLPLDTLAAHCELPRAGAWRCRVPEGRSLMLGDNRDHSVDSRAWGFLPHEQVYGKVVRVLFNIHDPSRRWVAL